MGVGQAIDLMAKHRKTVLALLEQHLPGTPAWAYGSRTMWTARPQSDLDLVVFATPEQRGQVGDLREAFEESNLPFRVDLFVWDDIPESFRERIEAQRVGLTAERTPPMSRHSAVGTEWTSINLGLACTKIGSGATPRGGRDVYLSNGPYALIRSQNVLNDGFRHNGLVYISDQQASELANVEVLDGDVLLNITGDSVARACQVDPHALPARVNQHVAIIRPDPGKLDARFLRYLLVSPEMQTRLLSWAGSGGTRNALTKGMIESFDVPAPQDIGEQRAIARVLGTLDDNIQLNRRMNATLEAMARALFKSWFVDFDPVRAKMEGRDTGLPKHIADLFPNRTVDSVLGEIPEGWTLKPLDSVAHFQNGLALQKHRPAHGQTRLPAVKIAQLRSGSADSGEWARASIKPEGVIENGDVVFSWSGSLLVRVWCGGRAALNQHLFKVTSDTCPKWLYLHYILSHFPEFERIAKDKATTMGHIRRHHLTEAMCVVAPDSVIDHFSSTFEKLLDRQVANESECRALEALRDTLLPRLVSGTVHLGNLGVCAAGDLRHETGRQPTT